MNPLPVERHPLRVAVEPPGGEVRNEALVQDEPSVLTQAAGMLPGAVDVAEPTTTALAPAQQVATGCSVLSCGLGSRACGASQVLPSGLYQPTASVPALPTMYSLVPRRPAAVAANGPGSDEPTGVLSAAPGPPLPAVLQLPPARRRHQDHPGWPG